MKRLGILIVTVLLSSGLLFAENEILLVGTALTTTSVAGGVYATSTLLSGSSRNDLETYVEENKSLVARDMSQADGESLEVISDIIGVSEEKREDFYTSLQTNYAAIFSTDEADSKVVTEKVVVIAAQYL